MDAIAATTPSQEKQRQRLVLAILAFASSGAALIYEVVWFQLLELIIGSSALSLSVLLIIFMGGMGAGSLIATPVSKRTRSVLYLYALIELGIAIYGLFIPTVLLRLNGALSSIAGSHLSTRVILAAACLLVPTILMGATLPVLVEWFNGDRESNIWVSYCYAGSLAGGAAGALLAGFYLLRIFDICVATWIAACVNGAGSLSAFLLSRRSSLTAPAQIPPQKTAIAGAQLHIYVATGLSGAVALSAEIIWTRTLSLAFGATVYVFSMVAALFLLGLAIGSVLVGAMLRKSRISPRIALGWCQIFSCLALTLAAHLLTAVIPGWQTSATFSAGPWHVLWSETLKSSLVILPGTIAWGASLPFAVASIDIGQINVGRKLGYVYAANTAGAILGAFGTAWLFAHLVGTQRIIQLSIILAAIGGLAVLVAAKSMGSTPKLRRGVRFSGYVEWACIAAGIVLLLQDISPLPPVLIAYGRRSADWIATSHIADTGRIIYAAEGLNDFVAVSQTGDGQLTFHASGKVQASTSTQDMRLQLLLGHLSHLVPNHPASVLVIGCGAGITAGALSIAPSVQRLKIVEIERLIPSVASTYFGQYNNHVIQNPKVSLVTDDGRHFLATTNDRFDVITTDLVDPWVKGVATLFTLEFFQLEKQHLNPGGVITQYVQLYQSSSEVVRSEIATFVNVFPNSVIFGNPRDGEGYDLVILGQVGPLNIDVDSVQSRLDSRPYAAVMNSLRSVGFNSAADLTATYAASASDLSDWLRGAPINRDRDLRLQYLAGLALDDEYAGSIYSQILSRRKLPPQGFLTPVVR